MIDDRDFENDFASDEYVKNNIRVRPTSGVSRVEDGQSSMFALERQTFNESDIEEQKYKRDVQHDISVMRETVRQKHEEYLERREIELAREAAKREGKRK